MTKTNKIITPKVYKKHYKNSTATDLVTVPSKMDQLAWTITGLTQSDGSFGFSFSEVVYGCKLKARPFFAIELNNVSYDLLKEVQSYFGCGNLSYVKNNKAVFSITDIKLLWHVIVPHFLKYPLYGGKQFAFIKFIEGLNISYQYWYKRRTPIVVGQIIYLCGLINAGTQRTQEDINNYYKTLGVNETIIKKSLLPYQKSFTSLESNEGYYDSLVLVNIYFIIGLINGDGSFYVGLRDSGQVQFGFNITTHNGEIDLLTLIRQRFRCGIVSYESSTWCRYEVTGVVMIRKILIPLVDTIGLGGGKSINYDIFKEAMHLYITKEYLTKSGHRRLAIISYSTTASDRYRKLTLEEYLIKHNLN